MNERVLLLSMTVGQGHNSAARAVADYLTEQGAECRILDTYKYLSPVVGNTFDMGYTYIVKHIPRLFGVGFSVADNVQYKENPKLEVTFPFLFADITKRKMAKYINEFKPDTIVCTIIFCAIIMTQLRKDKLIDENIRIIGVNTDFQVHPFWEFTDLDDFVVAADFMVAECEARGIDPKIVLPFGMPVKEVFNTEADTHKAKEALGLKDMFTVLLLSGGMGAGDIPAIVSDLDRLGSDIQLVVVCGSNKKTYNKLVEKKFSNPNIKILGFTDRMNDYMAASDIIYTKPGGLSTCESLAKNKPLMLMPPIPGIEEANRAYLVNNSLALETNQYIRGSSVLRMILNDPSILENMAKARARFVKKHSAKALGDYIIKQIAVRRDNNRENI